MRKIGFLGGSSLCELGPISDVDLFFYCIREFAIPKFPERNWNIIIDRLYRRYLRLDELSAAMMMMDNVREVFSSLPTSVVDWGINKNSSSLNIDRSTLAEIFGKYFEEFKYCKESAEIFLENWDVYQPVRVVVSDMPEFMTDKKRDLADYDALDGLPFWKLMPIVVG